MIPDGQIILRSGLLQNSYIRLLYPAKCSVQQLHVCLLKHPSEFEFVEPWPQHAWVRPGLYTYVTTFSAHPKIISVRSQFWNSMYAYMVAIAMELFPMRAGNSHVACCCTTTHMQAIYMNSICT